MNFVKKKKRGDSLKCNGSTKQNEETSSEYLSIVSNDNVPYM